MRWGNLYTGIQRITKENKMAENKKRANILNLVDAAWGNESGYVKSPSASDLGGATAGGKSTAYRKQATVVPVPKRRP